MNARRRKPVPSSTVQVGWTIIVRTGSGERAALRVDRLRRLTRDLIDVTGPGVYVGDPDRFRADARRHAIVLAPSTSITRVLPPHHPEAQP